MQRTEWRKIQSKLPEYRTITKSLHLRQGLYDIKNMTGISTLIYVRKIMLFLTLAATVCFKKDSTIPTWLRPNLVTTFVYPTRERMESPKDWINLLSPLGAFVGSSTLRQNCMTNQTTLTQVFGLNFCLIMPSAFVRSHRVAEAGNHS